MAKFELTIAKELKKACEDGKAIKLILASNTAIEGIIQEACDDYLVVMQRSRNKILIPYGAICVAVPS